MESFKSQTTGPNGRGRKLEIEVTMRMIMMMLIMMMPKHTKAMKTSKTYPQTGTHNIIIGHTMLMMVTNMMMMKL